MARKKAEVKTAATKAAMSNGEIVLALKAILAKNYKLNVDTESPELDTYTKAMLSNYYELPKMSDPVVALIRKALIAKGVVKSFKGKDSNLYDDELAEVVTEWQGTAKFNHESWEQILSI